jgi:hypothetical protein
MAKSRIVFTDNEEGTVDVKVFHNPKVVYGDPKTPAQEFAIMVYNGMVQANKEAEVNDAFGGNNER